MNHKGMTLIWITILLVVVCVLGAYYLKIKNQSNKTNITPALINDEKNNPQASVKKIPSYVSFVSQDGTFHGDGFTFQVLNGWKLNGSGLVTSRKTKEAATGDFSPGMAWIYTDSSNDTTENFINKLSGIDKKENIVISGISMVKITGYSGIGGTVYYQSVLLTHNHKLISLSLSTQAPKDLKTQLISEFEQMLKTIQLE